VPIQGAINGIQKPKTKISGFRSLIFFPTEIQLKGFTELTDLEICKSDGAGLSEN
jgi:hypothetical protein